MTEYEYPKMTESGVKNEIKNLEEGHSVAFAVEAQDRYKLQFSYTVTNIAPDSTVNIQGPRGGEWRFLIEKGRPQLEFKSPSNGWQKAGILDYVEGET